MVPSTSAARCADTRTRLARLLGMMGSQHDGEALNAARLADKLVREQGITWFNVISTAPPRASPDPPPPPRPSDDDVLHRFESASDANAFPWRRAGAADRRHQLESLTIDHYVSFPEPQPGGGYWMELSRVTAILNRNGALTVAGIFISNAGVACVAIVCLKGVDWLFRFLYPDEKLLIGTFPLDQVLGVGDLLILVVAILASVIDATKKLILEKKRQRPP